MNKEFQAYNPERWIVLKDDIYAAQRAIRLGIEHIETKIIEWESTPRLSEGSKRYLKLLKEEKDICEKALENLKEPIERL